MKKLTVFILLIALLAFSAQVNAEMIVVYYSEAGAAKTGLSVTIDITDVADGSLDIDDGACTELANGWYKYDFSDDATKNYTWLADGGAGLCDPERYIEGNIYLTTAKVNAESDQAIVDYDPPTDTEMLAAHTTTDALINGIDDNVWDDGTRTLTAFDEDDMTLDVDGTQFGLFTAALATSIGNIETDTGAYDTDAEYATAIWDAVLTGASHNEATSAGRRLRQLSIAIIREETAQAGATGSITLDSGASSTDGWYVGNRIVLSENTGAGQARTIVHYIGASKIAYVDNVWLTNPDATTVFYIEAATHTEHTSHGLAQAGANGSITLSSGASASNNYYRDQLVHIVGGTGLGQVRLISAYVGATKVASVVPDWVTNPDNTSIYHTDFGGRVNVGLVAGTAQTPNDNGADINTLISVLGALADAAAAGDPTEADTIMQYVKQLINILVGTTGIGTYPAEAAPGNGVSIAEVLRAVHIDVTGLNGDAMRGTDNAALAATALSSATWTAARAGYIDELAAANIPTDLATIEAVVDSILADTGTDGVKVSSLSASAVDLIIDEIIEGTLTMRQIFRILLAKNTGLTEGSGTATIKFRDLADSKYRITGTITDGNRVSVTLDGS